MSPVYLNLNCLCIILDCTVLLQARVPGDDLPAGFLRRAGGGARAGAGPGAGAVHPAVLYCGPVTTWYRVQVLGLLQSWATAFAGDPGLAGVGQVVAELRAGGVAFPGPSTQHGLLSYPAPGPAPASTTFRPQHPSQVPAHGPVPQQGGPAPPPRPGTGQLKQSQLARLQADLTTCQTNTEVIIYHWFSCLFLVFT